MKLINPQFKPAEFCRTVWYATPEPGTTIKDVLKPGFWTHVSSKLRKGDRIEVVPTDGEWFVELYVKTSNKVETFVAVMREVVLSEQVAKTNEKARKDAADIKSGKKKDTTREELPDYYVKFAGGAKWRVMRKEGNAVLQEGIATKELAQQWLDSYLKDIAA